MSSHCPRRDFPLAPCSPARLCEGVTGRGRWTLWPPRRQPPRRLPPSAQPGLLDPAPRTQRSAPSFLCMSTPRPALGRTQGMAPSPGQGASCKTQEQPGASTVTSAKATCADQETGEEIAQRGHISSAGTSPARARPQCGHIPSAGLRPGPGPEPLTGEMGLLQFGRKWGEGERERERKSADDATGGGASAARSCILWNSAKQNNESIFPSLLCLLQEFLFLL